MGDARLGSICKLLYEVLGREGESPSTDAQLLARFAASRDDAAFEVLVRRHSRTVWNACRRVLGREQDIEDAFQATFLALTHKAGSVTWRPSVANWLRRVARRIALKIKAKAIKQTNLEKQRAVTETIEDPTPACVWREIRSVLDEEIERLPRKYRLPFVLCHIEGKTNAEAGRELGCPESTIASQLARARQRLTKQLNRRGVTLSAGLGAAVTLEKAAITASVPAQLISVTVRAGLVYATSGIRSGVVSTEAIALAEGVVRTMLMSKIGIGVGLVMFVGLLAGGTGLMADRKSAMQPETDKIEKVTGTATGNVEKKIVEKRQATGVDCYGDPLPKKAVARIGTIRFRPGFWGDSSVAFLPDGKTLVSTHGANLVHFWDATTGKELFGFEGPQKCHRVAVSSNGEKLAVIGEREVWAWDLSANPPRRLFCYQHSNTMVNLDHSAVVFAPGGKTLAVGGVTPSNTKKIAPKNATLLFDVATGNLQMEFLNNENQSVYEGVMAFSPDGNILAVGDALWDVATRTKRCDLKIDWKVDGYLHCLAFSRDGKTLATTTGTRKIGDTLSLWDTATGTKIYQIALDSQHRFVSFLPDGKTLLETDGVKICLKDPATGKTKSSASVTCSDAHPIVNAGVHRMCLSADGKLLAQVNDLSTIDVWEVATGRKIGPNGGIPSVVLSLAFSPDNKQLVTLARMDWNHYKLQLWDAGTAIQKLEHEVNHYLFETLDYSGDHHIDVPSLENPDNTWIRWNTQTGEATCVTMPLKEFPKKGQLYCAISSNGRWQIFGNKDSVILIDRLANKEIRRFPELSEAGSLDFVAASADGRSLLSVLNVNDGHAFGTRPHIAVWSAETGKQLLDIATHWLKITQWFEPPAVALSPDGRRVAAVLSDEKFSPDGFRIPGTLGEGSTIRVWEIASGSEGKTFAAPAGVNILAWSPDGCHLASGNAKGDIQLWDVMAGQQVCDFKGHRGCVRSLAFSRDGLRLASGGYDTTVLIWDLGSPSGPGVKATAKLPSANKLWNALSEQEAIKALPVMHLLTQNPDVALSLLRERLRAVPMPDAKRVAALLVQLDDENFQKRNQAVEHLEKMGERIVPALQEALAKKPSLEACQLINKVLHKVLGRPVGMRGLYPGQLQVCRGVEVLERIGAPAARQLLEELIQSAPYSLLASEGKAALQRITK